MQLSEQKIKALQSVDFNNYKVLSPSLIQANNKNYFILTDKEKESIENNILLNQLPQASTDFLLIYTPRDIPEEHIAPIIENIKQIPDEYSKIRLIQTLIDWERYLKDMKEPLPDEKGELHPIEIIQSDVAFHSNDIYILQLKSKA